MQTSDWQKFPWPIKWQAEENIFISPLVPDARYNERQDEPYSLTNSRGCGSNGHVFTNSTISKFKSFLEVGNIFSKKERFKPKKNVLASESFIKKNLTIKPPHFTKKLDWTPSGASTIFGLFAKWIIGMEFFKALTIQSITSENYFCWLDPFILTLYSSFISVNQ